MTAMNRARRTARPLALRAGLVGPCTLLLAMLLTAQPGCGYGLPAPGGQTATDQNFIDNRTRDNSSLDDGSVDGDAVDPNLNPAGNPSSETPGDGADAAIAIIAEPVDDSGLAQRLSLADDSALPAESNIVWTIDNQTQLSGDVVTHVFTSFGPHLIKIEVFSTAGQLLHEQETAVDIDDGKPDDTNADLDRRILAVLSAMRPLPKPHHYAPGGLALLPEWLDFTREIVRITRSASIAPGYGASATRTMISLAAQANAAEPDAIPTTVSFYYGPWREEYLEHGHEVTDFGPLYVQGLERMREFFTNQAQWIADANREMGASITVGNVILEIENWPIPVGGDPEWEVALLRRHNECYDLVKSIFPAAPVTWFDRGGVHQNSGNKALPFFGETGRFTHLEKGDFCSTRLYRVGDSQSVTLEEMRRTITNVDQYYGPGTPIVPFISLGAGYRFRLDSPKEFIYDRDWNYDAVHSYQLGMYVNLPVYSESLAHVQLGADWSRVPQVMFYPPILDHKLTKDSLYIRLRHFVAYCCGATEAQFPGDVFPFE